MPLAACSNGLNSNSCRRSVLAGAAAFLTLGPLAPAMANTAPMLDKPMEGFGTDESKRSAFKEKQKKYKKAWRKSLSDLEFATTDAEAITAVDNLYALIKEKTSRCRRACGKWIWTRFTKRCSLRLAKMRE